jgi:hypothetical protein
MDKFKGNITVVNIPTIAIKVVVKLADLIINRYVKEKKQCEEAK